jgi:hypothetical protein
MLILLPLLVFAVKLPLLTNQNISNLYEMEGFLFISYQNDYHHTTGGGQSTATPTAHSQFHVNLNETRLLSLLELKQIPSLFYLKSGLVTCFNEKHVDEEVLKFLKNPKSKMKSYLPTSYSVINKIQLDLYYYSLKWIDGVVKFIDRVLSSVKIYPGGSYPGNQDQDNGNEL